MNKRDAKISLKVTTKDYFGEYESVITLTQG